jgi:hypothetical protein
LKKNFKKGKSIVWAHWTVERSEERRKRILP